MTLLLYIAVLAFVLYWRSRQLKGDNLAFQLNDDGTHYLKKVISRNAGSKYNRRMQHTLMVGQTLNQPAFFNISQEKWYHRLLKSLGLTTEIEFGDEELDRHLFFMSDTPESFSAYALNAEFMQRIRTLFKELNAKKLQAYHGKIWVTSKKQDSQISDSFIQKNLAEISALVKLIEAAPSSGEVFVHRKPQYALFFMACHAALFTLGVVGILPIFFENSEILNMKGLAFWALNAGFGFLAAWFGMMYLSLRSSGWFALVIADFVLFGIAGILLSSVFIVREANITLDKNTPRPYTVPLVSKDCELYCSRRSGKRTRSVTFPLSEAQCLPSARDATLAHYQTVSYYCNSNHSFKYRLTLKSWNLESPHPYSFKASEALYDSARIGRAYQVIEHPGFFRFKWVSTDEIRPQ